MVVERVNTTHMEVRWTALSPVEARGHITHYTISYWPAFNSEHVMSITVHNTTSTGYRVLIGGLLPGEGYVVEVSASTAVGEGDKTEVNLSRADGIYSGEVRYLPYYYGAAPLAGVIHHMQVHYNIVFHLCRFFIPNSSGWSHHNLL